MQQAEADFQRAYAEYVNLVPMIKPTADTASPLPVQGLDAAQAKAEFLKPVRDVQNVFGRPNRTTDDASLVDIRSSLRPQEYGPRTRDPFSGQLPYAGMAAEPSAVVQLMPEETRTGTMWMDMNARETETPFYQRYWPVTPLEDKRDVVLDPRYTVENTRRMAAYQSLQTSGNTAVNRTQHPNYGL